MLIKTFIVKKLRFVSLNFYKKYAKTQGKFPEFLKKFKFAFLEKINNTLQSK